LARPIHVLRLGRCEYQEAWRWQVETANALREGRGDEAIALVEHLPVYTFGRRPRYEHLLIDPTELRARGADVIESDRGGDVTFHGPGQLVAYPILDLRRRGLGPVDYVRALEATLIETLDRFGIRGERVAGRPGVWGDGAKIAALGVRIQGGVSLHGIALNVDTDLSWFDAIVPCGISDAAVTSMERVLGHTPGLEAVSEAFAEAFATVYKVGLAPVRPAPVEGQLVYGDVLRQAQDERNLRSQPVLSRGR
jgi:lipoate-protein ligase B